MSSLSQSKRMGMADRGDLSVFLSLGWTLSPCGCDSGGDGTDRFPSLPRFVYIGLGDGCSVAARRSNVGRGSRLTVGEWT